MKYFDTLGSTQMGKDVRGTSISFKYVNTCLLQTILSFIVLPESGTAGPMYVNSFTVKKKENLILVNSNWFP